MNRFELFLSQLKETNSTLGSFTDFDKVRANTKKVAIKLNQLNYLIGQNDLHGAIKELFDENPKGKLTEEGVWEKLGADADRNLIMNMKRNSHVKTHPAFSCRMRSIIIIIKLQ